jgi:hypothetical protein
LPENSLTIITFSSKRINWFVPGTSLPLNQFFGAIARFNRARSEPTRGKVWKAEMTHWDDTMADRPEADDPAYVSGWTIPGLAVLVVLVTVWILGI